MLGERIKRIKERVCTARPEIFADRARLITESYEKTQGMPYVLRRAYALRDILQGMEIAIHPDELIVGAAAKKPRGCQVFPEYDMGFVINELDSFEHRTADSFFVSEDTKAALRGIYPKWQDNSLTACALELFDDEQKDSLSGMVFALTALRSGVGHMIVDYPLLLEKGMDGIRELLNERQASLMPDGADYAQKLIYCKAALICCDAVCELAMRYSRLAEEMAAEESEPLRREELLGISRRCARVPAQPAESFLDALQSFWFIHLVLQIESNGHSVSPGRFDQYIYPYFRAELDRGRSEAELFELLELLWIKFYEVNKVRDKVSSLAFGGYPMFQNLMVGGQDKNGRSAVNRLSHLCIDASAQLMLPQPSLSARWFFGIEDSFLDHCFDLIALGTGMPALFNDEVLIPNMLHMGYSLEEARDYAIVGCTETSGQGNVEPWLTGGFLNAQKVLELTIFNGMDILSGTQHSFRSGCAEDFGSFDEFFDAYKKQLAFYLGKMIACNNSLDYLHGALCPTPLESVLIDGCIDSCKTSLEGGAKYNATTLEVVALPNAADSLMAIKQAVYEEKSIGWAELMDALHNDFKGREELRLRLKNRYPKYGNDDDRVDDIAREILDTLYSESLKYRSPRGGQYRIALYSIASHVMFATKTAASADGRHAFEVLADGGVSCAHGRDREGMTALLNTVLKMDPYKALGSTLLNVRLSPSLLRAQDRKKTEDAVKSFFMRKGQHIQFNVFDAQTLRDAQDNPGKYPTLMVRVAGFSVLFNSIDRQLQDDIISRTEQESGELKC